MSARSLAGAAAALLFLGFVYWLVLRALEALGAGASAGAGLAPLSQRAFSAMAAGLGFVAVYVLLILGVNAAFTRYALTDSRVLWRGLRRFGQADLADLGGVEVVQSAFGTLLDFGDVVIRTAGDRGVIILRRVDQPHLWSRDIEAAIETRDLSSASG